MSESTALEFENPQERALANVLAGNIQPTETQWIDHDRSVGVRLAEYDKPILQIVVDGVVVTSVVRDHLSSTTQLQRLIQYHTRRVRGEVDEDEPETAPAWH